MITSDNEDIYKELRDNVRQYADECRIVNIFKRKLDKTEFIRPKHMAKIGKYGYVSAHPFLYYGTTDVYEGLVR